MAETTISLSVLHDDVVFAWAAQVSLSQMAASVEAYVQTKAAITTFRLAAKYTRTKSLSKLPEEIKERIAVIVRDTSFRRNMRQWTKIYECLSGRCNIESHFKKEKIKRAAYRHQRASETGEIDPLTWHRLRMEHYCNVLAPNSSSTLRKCVQRFAQECGIYPYIICTKRVAPFGEVFEVNAKAYLIFPVAQAPIWDNSRPGIAGFTINDAVDTSLFTAMTDKQRVQFHTAARLLQLHPYDPDEDETVFVDGTSDDDNDTAYDPHEDETVFMDGTSDDDSDTEKSTTTESDNAEDGIEDSSNSPENKPGAPEPPHDADAAAQKPQEKDLKPELRFFASRELNMRYGRV